jgi:MraZ protein
MLERQYGYWDVVIEKSGRVKLPTALLKSLPEECRAMFWLTRGFGKHIMLWTKPAFQQQLDYLDSLDDNIIKNKLYRNAFLKNLTTVECDSQNRFVIPRPLMTSYQIDKEVVVVLTKGRIELWNPKEYNEQFDLSPEEFALLNEEISIQATGKEEPLHE